eukprot:TRINITY_DN9819_c0_g1_i1.p1 TRINITY_DN9819_c0_g1~~TRINITY_DN9819_c0_g1_i1.p1  ORF type:complete len:553 (+),score=100.56 TRINITY_DN9819_c0_g1_i1:64-1722(+)
MSFPVGKRVEPGQEMIALATRVLNRMKGVQSTLDRSLSEKEDLAPTPVRWYLLQQAARAVVDAHSDGEMGLRLSPDLLQIIPPELKIVIDRQKKLGPSYTLAHATGSELLYAAPETFLRDEVSEAADVYGLGMLLFEIMTGVIPFEQQPVIAATLAAHENLRPTFPEQFDPDLKKLIQDCWSANPADRPNSIDLQRALRSIARRGGADEVAEALLVVPPVRPVRTGRALPLFGATRIRDESENEAIVTRSFGIADEQPMDTYQSFEEGPDEFSLKSMQASSDLEFDFPEIQSSEMILGQPIGEGHFGKVLSGRVADVDVAIKLLKISNEEYAQALAELSREASLMNKLRHPNIVALVGVCLKPLTMITELCPLGNLYSILRTQTRIEHKARVSIALDVARGMNFMHTFKPDAVLHRDLKTANILVGSGMQAKVADFGLSRVKNRTATGEQTLLDLLTVAPEVLRSHTAFAEYSDVYSYALVLWEMYSRRTAFEGEDIRQVAFKVLYHQMRPQIDSDCDETYGNLIRWCWHDDPTQRPSFAQIVACLEQSLQS